MNVRSVPSLTPFDALVGRAPWVNLKEAEDACKTDIGDNSMSYMVVEVSCTHLLYVM